MAGIIVLDPIKRKSVTTERFVSFDLNLAVRPSRDLHNIIDNAVIRWVWVEWDIVPERYWVSILFKPYSPVLSSRLLSVYVKKIARDGRKE